MSYKVEECRICGSRYSEYPGDKNSIEEDIYIRHLGFCDMDCYNKLNDKAKDYYMLHNFLFGEKFKKDKIPVPHRHLR